MYIVIIIILFSTVLSIPPACFISCTSEIARTCANGLTDLTCLCNKEDEIVTCLVDICPFGVFVSARDHYIGTCLEHGRPTVTNPFPPDAIWPPYQDQEPEEQPQVPEVVEQPGEQESVEQPQEIEPVEPPPSPPQEPAPFEQPQQQKQDTTFRTQFTKTPNLATHTLALPTKSKVPSHSKNSNHPASDDYNNGPNKNFDSDGSDDDLYDPNSVCEWEETDALDENGDFIIIRRPINVPKKYRNPSNVGNTRRVFIKRPVNYYSHGNIEDSDPPRRAQRVKKINTLKSNKKSSNGSSNVYSKSKASTKKTPKKPPQTLASKMNEQKKRTRVNKKSL